AYGGSIGGITWVNKVSAAADKRAAYIGTVFDDANQDASDINFWTRENSGYLTQKMQIRNDGTVRIEGPTVASTGVNAISVGGFGNVGVDAPGNPNGRFVVSENGSVGIGNNNPSYKLDVNGSTRVAPNATSGNANFVVGDNPSGTALFKMLLTPNTGQSGLLINNTTTSDYSIYSQYENDYENGVFRNIKPTGKSTSVSAINFSSNDTASCFRAYAPDGATGLTIETYNGTNGGQGINVRSKNKHALRASAEKQAAYIVSSPTAIDNALLNGAVEVNMNSNLNADYPAISCRNTLVPNYGIGIIANGGYIGVRGLAQSVGNGGRFGVFGSASGGISFNYGVYGNATGTNAYAGYFDGNTHINGNLSKAGGTFKIDHPMDPANKYLIHSFIESPDMMNVYNGNITTDANGFAVVSLPSYFEVENKDFKYQLTVIDNSNDFVMAKVSEKVANNSFKIKTSKPNVEVSWQVTGVRQDVWANANRVVAEVEKNEQEKGKYLHPELHGQPTTKSMTYDNKNEK
ncbi:MAG TPA: hypothetical protein PLU10_04295, partial [Chitinophagaceae bacterium]|nr:hypothetical protein [Chitinophagaceae bacterium]